MSSAREIIAAATYESWENIPAASTRTWDVYCDKLTGGAHHFRKHAGAAIEALTAAGFRILAPGELDPATVERCADFALNEFQRDFESPAGWREQFATAIRTLTGGNNGR